MRRANDWLRKLLFQCMIQYKCYQKVQLLADCNVRHIVLRKIGLPWQETKPRMFSYELSSEPRGGFGKSMLVSLGALQMFCGSEGLRVPDRLRG
jgi:hypothetical protein